MNITTTLIIIIVVYLAGSYVVRRFGLFSTSLSPADLREKLTNGDNSVSVIDVRSVPEYRSGHIPTAMNIPHDTISAKPPKAPKDATIVLYCESGSRSLAAKSALKRLGYTNVTNFGSLNRWRGPLVEGSDPGDMTRDVTGSE